MRCTNCGHKITRENKPYGFCNEDCADDFEDDLEEESKSADKPGKSLPRSTGAHRASSLGEGLRI